MDGAVRIARQPEDDAVRIDPPHDPVQQAIARRRDESLSRGGLENRPAGRARASLGTRRDPEPHDSPNHGFGHPDTGKPRQSRRRGSGPRRAEWIAHRLRLPLPSCGDKPGASRGRLPEPDQSGRHEEHRAPEVPRIISFNSLWWNWREAPG